MTNPFPPFPPFIYASGQTPPGYECQTCQCTGVRLYRRYQTFLERQELFCRKHALDDQNKTEPDQPSEHSIGWLVAAIPTEDGSTHWGWSSVPDDGLKWWNQLPKTTNQPAATEGAA